MTGTKCRETKEKCYAHTKMLHCVSKKPFNSALTANFAPVNTRAFDSCFLVILKTLWFWIKFLRSMIYIFSQKKRARYGGRVGRDAKECHWSTLTQMDLRRRKRRCRQDNLQVFTCNLLHINEAKFIFARRCEDRSTKQFWLQNNIKSLDYNSSRRESSLEKLCMRNIFLSRKKLQ